MYRVLHVLSSLRYGGAEVLVRDIVSNLPSSISFEVIYHTEGELKNELTPQIKRIDFNKFSLKEIYSFRKYIKKSGVNIVHVHSVVNPLRLLPVLVFTNVRTVFTVHGKSLHRNKFTKFIAFKFFDSIIFVSKSVKNVYLDQNKSWPNKFKVIYNGVDPNKFSIKKSSFKNHAPANNEEFLFGFVGNFNPDKDQYTICKSLRILKDRGCNFKFLFIGSKQKKEFFDQCYNYCEENDLLNRVNFLGLRRDIPELLSSLDLFVYSSNNETFGIAVVEAMMSETPVVANDLDVFREITNNGRFAELYKTKDEYDLADKIIKLINNKKRMEWLRKEPKEWALKKFSIENHVIKLIDHYQDLLKS